MQPRTNPMQERPTYQPNPTTIQHTQHTQQICCLRGTIPQRQRNSQHIIMLQTTKFINKQHLRYF